MGRDWQCSLKVFIGVINSMTVSNKTEVSNKLAVTLQKHDAVFTEELGTFTGAKVTLHIDPPRKAKVFQTTYLTFLS